MKIILETDNFVIKELKGIMKSRLNNLIVLLFLVTTISAQFDDSMVAHYRLSVEYYDNQVSGRFYDLSGNGHHATPAKTPNFTIDYTGQPNTAMNFDGLKDYINCGNSEDFEPNRNDYTIIVWFKFDSDVLSRRNSVGTFLSNIGSDKRWKLQHYTEENFEYTDGDDNLRFIYDNQGTKSICINYCVLGFEKGWKMFAFTFNDDAGPAIPFYNATDLNSYLVWRRGLPGYNGYIPHNLNTNRGDFIIGCGDPQLMEEPFKGKMAEVQIWNRALSQDEIKQLLDDKFPLPQIESFEDGSIIDANMWKSCSGYDAGLKLVESPVSHGNYAIQLTNTDPANTPGGNHRVELEYSNTLTYTPGKEVWRSFDIMLSEDFDGSEESWNCFGQYFPTGDSEYGPGWSAYPVYALSGNDQKLFLDTELYTGDPLDEDLVYHGEISPSYPGGPISENPHFTQNRVSYEAYGLKIEKGKWYTVTTHIRVANDSTGFIGIWVDGQSLLPENLDTLNGDWYVEQENDVFHIRNHYLYGRNSGTRSGIGRTTIGYYRDPKATTTNSIYFDNIKTGYTPESVGFYFHTK